MHVSASFALKMILIKLDANENTFSDDVKFFFLLSLLSTHAVCHTDIYTLDGHDPEGTNKHDRSRVYALTSSFMLQEF